MAVSFFSRLRHLWRETLSAFKMTIAWRNYGIVVMLDI